MEGSVRKSEDDLPQAITFEAILPAAMAARAEEGGIKRAAMDPVTVFVLSVMAGAFISFGAIFATTVSAGNILIAANDSGTASAALPYGVMRLLAGLVFSLGLIMVVVGGAELFTGNNMIVMAWASRKVTTGALLKNWCLAFVGNAFGTLCTALLMFASTQYTFGNGSVGLAALNTAASKAALPFVPALALGLMCNTLVCLAVWMCYSARTTIDRIVTIVPPITAFVASGFEHSIANIYFIPMGLLIKVGAPDSFWTSIGKTPDDFSELTWAGFFSNLIPVTIGNIIGGSFFVAAVYWFVYLRRRPLSRNAA